MMAQGVVDEPVFSFVLSRDASSTQGGELVLGGLPKPTSVSGEIIYVPVSKKGYWQFEAQAFNIGDCGGGGVATSGPFQAIADTGTSLLTAPSRIVEVIVNELKKKCGPMCIFPVLTECASIDIFVLSPHRPIYICTASLAMTFTATSVYSRHVLY